MSTIPKSQLILGYTEFFKTDPPKDRLSIVSQICKRNLIAELAGLNYRLKPKTSKYHDTSLDFQINELNYFCGGNDALFKSYSRIASTYTVSEQDYPLIFTRQTCLFGLEEILQSSLPVIENFNMTRVEVWEAILKYILAVNTALTRIEKNDEKELINFETLNPKMLPLNELSLNSDPIYIPYRGYKLLEYLDSHAEVGSHLKDYFNTTYSVSFDYFVYETMGMYFANQHDNATFDFYYNVNHGSKHLFDILSNTYKSTDIAKLLSIRKYPFYKSTNNSYILTDNILLLEKLYNQFINDFWFDHIKLVTKQDGSKQFDIKKYKSIIGYFFENYIKEIIDYSFRNAKYYSILQFDQLKINYKGNQIEIADLYIRYNSKIILSQVKSTTLYDNEKYAGNVDEFYKNDRNKFFNSFGVDQLVNSIKILNDTMPVLDNKFPKNKSLKIFPIIIFNEKALQTPLMGKIFQDRFNELLKNFKNNKIYIYPLSLIHVSDLENLQDFLFANYAEIWDLLKFHCRNPKFMPPFFNSINRKDIRPNYKRTMTLYETLIPKYSRQKTAGNRVDGLTTCSDEVRLSHHCTYGSRIQRFGKS